MSPLRLQEMCVSIWLINLLEVQKVIMSGVLNYLKTYKS